MRRSTPSILTLSLSLALGAACAGGSKTGDKDVIAITVAPPNPSAAVGGTLAFTATAHLHDGEAKDVSKDPDTTWTSSDSSVATVANDGNATAIGGGATLITASRGDLHSPPQQLTVATTPPPTPTPTPAPTANHIVISEVMYDPVGSSETNTEYMELFNPTSATVTLSNWTLVNKNGTGTAFTFAVGSSAAAGTFVVISRDSATLQATYGATPNYVGTTPSLLNSGDTLLLKDAGGALVDAVAWEAGSGGLPMNWCATSGKPSSATDSGHSVSRKPQNTDGDNCNDWVSDTAPTPGAPPP